MRQSAPRDSVAAATRRVEEIDPGERGLYFVCEVAGVVDRAGDGDLSLCWQEPVDLSFLWPQVQSDLTRR